MFSDEILKITLHHTSSDDRDTRQSNETGMDDQIEPKIGIIKLGEDLNAKSTPVKNQMCEHCGKSFSKTNQLQVHKRIHTSKWYFD